MAASIDIAKYENAAITQATNPSAHGYHHGLVPNHSHGFVPPTLAEERESRNNTTYLRALTSSEHVNPDHPGVDVSAVNGGVCMFEVAPGHGVMCGRVCAGSESLRRHMRTYHPGAMANRGRHNILVAEREA